MFVDRDFGNGNVIAETEWGDTGSAVKKINITFKVPQAIDVSSPWRQDDQIKLAIAGINQQGITYALSTAASAARPKAQAQNLFLFGTRSTGIDYDINLPPIPSTSSDWCNGPAFRIDDFFTRNTGVARIGYIRVRKDH